MPRPPKRGLDYFGKDVDFYEDFKIIDLLSEYGPVGVVIYDFLLTQIYKNGYYLELPIDKAALLAVRAIGSRSVSYTHLDVYKRQKQQFSVRCKIACPNS